MTMEKPNDANAEDNAGTALPPVSGSAATAQPCNCTGGLDFLFFEWLEEYGQWVISTGDDYSGRVYILYCPYCGSPTKPPNVRSLPPRDAEKGNEHHA